MARRLLIDRDRGRKTFDTVHIRLLHLTQEHTGIRRQGFDITSLSLGINSIESDRALARSRQTGQNNKLISRNIKIYILEVVLPGPVNPYVFIFFHNASNRIYVRFYKVIISYHRKRNYTPLPFRKGCDNILERFVLRINYSLIDGPMVKRLRRRPLKAQSRVRFSLGSPLINPVHSNRVFFCFINHDLRSIDELHFKRSRISLIQIQPLPLQKIRCRVRLLCT